MPSVGVVAERAFERCLGDEGEAPMSGISSLIKEVPGSSLDPSTRQGPRRTLQARIGASLGQAGTLISNSMD